VSVGVSVRQWGVISLSVANLSVGGPSAVDQAR
jgi:hypothetical protein